MNNMLINKNNISKLNLNISDNELYFHWIKSSRLIGYKNINITLISLSESSKLSNNIFILKYYEYKFLKLLYIVLVSNKEIKKCFNTIEINKYNKNNKYVFISNTFDNNKYQCLTSIRLCENNKLIKDIEEYFKKVNNDIIRYRQNYFSFRKRLYRFIFYRNK